MAFGGLLALLDDIASVLDDVAAMSKVAVKQTAGIVGDDLAVGAATVAHPNAEREIPVVWAVAKGSFINKLFLIPGALLLNAVAPFVIKPILMLGGAYLCYEGAEKIFHAVKKNGAEKKHQAEIHQALQQEGPEALMAAEKEKIAGAVRTDLILSGEIVAVTLGIVAAQPFLVQLGVLCGIGLLMTIGVYGLVGGIVKLDDLGFFLIRRGRKKLGAALVAAMPKVMRGLAIVGTAAMILVGGGLIVHKGVVISAAAGLAVGFALVFAVQLLKKARAT